MEVQKRIDYPQEGYQKEGLESAKDQYKLRQKAGMGNA
jgi:hypothetical protein